jgi:hypothetical protein
MPGHPLPLSAEDRRSQTGRMLLRLIELHEPRRRPGFGIGRTDSLRAAHRSVPTFPSPLKSLCFSRL